LDFPHYAERKRLAYSVMKNYGITVEHLKEMTKEQGITLRPGDILLVRCGMSKWIHESTPESEAPSQDKGGILGIEPSEELYEWIWNNRFAAVGSDTVAFECLPAADGSCKFPPAVQS
jgi:kynurenine formamidase